MSDDHVDDFEPPRESQRFSERLNDITVQLLDASEDEDSHQEQNQANGIINNRLNRHLQTLMVMARRNAQMDNLQGQLGAAFPTLGSSRGRGQRRSTTVTVPGRRQCRNPYDRRRSDDVRIRLTALDSPTITSSASVNLARLNVMGLGRKEQTTRVPAGSSADKFHDLIRSMFPVLVNHDYEVLVGRRGCSFELVPVPDATHLKDLRANRVGRTPIPIWIRPTSEISQGPDETDTDQTPGPTEQTASESSTSGPDLPNLTATDTEYQPNPASETPEDDDFYMHINVPFEAGLDETDKDQAPGPTEPQPQTAASESSTSGPNLPNTTATVRFVDADTPTVQFRASTRTLLDVTRDISQPRDGQEDTEVPEIRTSRSSRTVTTSHQLKETIRQHARDFIRATDEDPLIMAVRRSSVVLDALKYIRVSQDDLSSPLQISFLDEGGIDLGGLRREFWMLFLNQVSHSSLVTGRPGCHGLRKNFIELQKKTFFYLGQLVSLSILQDGPGLPIFGDVVCHYILGQTCEEVSEGDLPQNLAELIDKMKAADSDAAAQKFLQEMFDDATAAGFIIAPTSFKKRHIPALVGALVHNLVEGSRAELDQFIDGLRTHQVLDMLRLQPDDSFSLFSGRIKPVTVAAIRQLLKFHYRAGNLEQVDMQTAHGFLTFLQATKGSTATVDGIKLQPHDVLMWMTGSASIPAVGFHKLIDVEFGDSLRVNTCALVLTLTEVPPAVDDDVQYYTRLLINSQTFQLD